MKKKFEIFKLSMKKLKHIYVLYKLIILRMICDWLFNFLNFNDFICMILALKLDQQRFLSLLFKLKR